jgi:hypothetical protein
MCLSCIAKQTINKQAASIRNKYYDLHLLLIKK